MPIQNPLKTKYFLKTNFVHKNSHWMLLGKNKRSLLPSFYQNFDWLVYKQSFASYLCKPSILEACYFYLAAHVVLLWWIMYVNEVSFVASLQKPESWILQKVTRPFTVLDKEIVNISVKLCYLQIFLPLPISGKHWQITNLQSLKQK